MSRYAEDAIWLRERARSYNDDARRWDTDPALINIDGAQRWAVVYRAVATELHRLADEAEKR